MSEDLLNLLHFVNASSESEDWWGEEETLP